MNHVTGIDLWYSRNTESANVTVWHEHGYQEKRTVSGHRAQRLTLLVHTLFLRGKMVVKPFLALGRYGWSASRVRPSPD